MDVKLESHSSLSNQSQRNTVLLVDDSRLVRYALKSVLSGHYELVEAVDGEMAWDCLSQNPSIQLVLSDLDMPNLDGYGLLNRIRNAKEKNIAEVPVIILTGNDQNHEAKQKALDFGASRVMHKPFETQHLLLTVHEMIEDGLNDNFPGKTLRFSEEELDSLTPYHVSNVI